MSSSAGKNMGGELGRIFWHDSCSINFQQNVIQEEKNEKDDVNGIISRTGAVSLCG
mgnify:CR=1 FL=1